MWFEVGIINSAGLDFGYPTDSFQLPPHPKTKQHNRRINRFDFLHYTIVFSESRVGCRDLLWVTYVSKRGEMEDSMKDKTNLVRGGNEQR